MANADKALIERLRASDPNAFATVFHEHYMMLIRFARTHVSSMDIAEDVVQDVFVRVWERRETLDPDRPVLAYLIAAVRNDAMNRNAHEAVVAEHRARSLRERGVDAAVSDAPTAHELVEANELAQQAEQQVAMLSPRLREIYQLARVEGLAPREIADALGISVNTVYVQYAKILRALHPTLERWLRE